MKTDIEHLADLKANPDDKRHGTERGARLGCRCPACREAAFRASERARERMAASRKKKREREPVKRNVGIPEKRSPKDCCTIAEFLLHLMGRPSIDNVEGRCCWCGKPGATNKHHIVKRSAGKLVVGGVEVKKPTIRLCGDGNASGCHGKAHSGLLHFDFVDQARNHAKHAAYSANGTGHWVGKEFDEPCDILSAWESDDGWRRL